MIDTLAQDVHDTNNHKMCTINTSSNSLSRPRNLRLLIPRTKRTQLAIIRGTLSLVLAHTRHGNDALVPTWIMCSITAAIPCGGNDQYAGIVGITIGIVVRCYGTIFAAERHGDDLGTFRDAVVNGVDDIVTGAGAAVGKTLANVERKSSGIGIDSHDSHWNV